MPAGKGNSDYHLTFQQRKARVTENFAAAFEDVELDLVAKLSRINQSLNDAVKEESKQRSQQKRDDLKKIAGIAEKLKKGEAEYDEKHATFEKKVKKVTKLAAAISEQA